MEEHLVVVTMDVQQQTEVTMVVIVVILLEKKDMMGVASHMPVRTEVQETMAKAGSDSQDARRMYVPPHLVSVPSL